MAKDKINKSFICWVELIQGVPIGSVLGLLIFGIYWNDLFDLAECIESCNFADDTIIFGSDKDLKTLISKLERMIAT